MRAFFSAVAMLLVSACSGQSFDRDDAEKLIVETEQASALGQQIMTYPGYLEDGEAQGLWTTENSPSPVMDAQVSEQISELAQGYVRPVVPASIAVNVTGIREIPDDGTSTSAEFEWRYAELPKYIKRFALLGGSGKASFQKFDDGWRISSVSFSRADIPAELSSTEMDEINGDVGKETARRNAIIERIRTSFAQGREIKSYEVDFYGVKQRYTIFENGVAGYQDLLDKSGWTTGKMKQSSFVWFGSMFNMREGGYGVQYTSAPNSNNFQSFLTTHYKMNTGDFLKTVNSAHAEWTRKYGDLPLTLRQRVYFESQATP